MRVAIIAVEHRLIEHGQLFALSLVNGHPFLLRQIDALIAGGAEKLILIAAQRPRPILDLCHELSGRQIDIEIVHLLRDVRVDQRWTRVLFLTDQLILSPHAVEEAFIEDQGFLWASEDNSLNADLEHIDLHRRWLGIMSLSLSYFDGLSQMEEHWSPASYLLRHVLQQKVGQRILTDGELQQKRIQIIHDEAAIKQYAHQRRIDYWQAGAYSITFYMVSFLLKAVIEPVWERKNTISLSLGGGGFLVFLAFFCLFLGIFVRGAIFLVPPIAFLANIILLAYHNMINIRADGDRAAHIEWPCHLLNLLNPFIILSFALVYSGYGLSVDGTIREKIALMAGDGSIFYVNVIIALSLLLILWRHGYTDRVNGYERWRPDSAFILLTLSLSLFIPLLYILLILLIFIPLWQGILIGSKEKDNNFVKLMRWVRAKLTT